jgi:hypothetical protein
MPSLIQIGCGTAGDPHDIGDAVFADFALHGSVHAATAEAAADVSGDNAEGVGAACQIAILGHNLPL